MKSRVLAVSVLSLAMLFAAAQGVPAQPSGCALVSASIWTGTDTVASGTGIAIGGSINNCSSQKQRYTVVVWAMSSCGQKSDIASSKMAFNSGENKMYSVSTQIPLNTCAGPWVATVEVRDNGGPGGLGSSSVMTSASATLTIQ